MGSLGGFLSHLRVRFEAEGVPFVIGDAFALAARGHPRFTDDVDVMVLTRDLTDVQILASEGKLDWEHVRAWARRMGYGEAYDDLRAPSKPRFDDRTAQP